MPLISVIIPIYNAEKYLENTINSVINQTIGFENIELILVDDSSTDNSRKIIQKYVEQYNNIIPYYSEKNHGFPGFGRNIGLEKSTSDYIMFLDNDDEYDEDICKKLYETVTKENADVVCCNKISIDFLNNIKKTIEYENGIEKDDEIIISNNDILFFKNIAVWNKIFKKEIIRNNNLNFLENTTADDFAFTISYFIHSKKLIYLKDYYGYKWNIGDSSLSHAVTENQITELITTYKFIYYYLKKENKSKFTDGIIKDHLTYLLTQCSYLKIKNDEFTNVLKEIYEFEIEIKFSAKLNEKWADITNHFILNKQFKLARMNLKCLNILRQSNILRKIKRRYY